MFIEEGDQERWNQLPGLEDSNPPDEASSEETLDFIESIRIEGQVYVYASCLGPVQIQHESEKVRLLYPLPEVQLVRMQRS